MKKIIALFLLASFSLAALAQKTINDPNVEKRTVGSFHAIEVSSGIDLFLSHGSEALAVSASDTKYRDRIKTEVKDGVLKIWYERIGNIEFNMDVKKKLKAYVSFSTLDRLKATSGSDVKVDGAIETNKLSLELSSGADFEGKVNATDLVVEQSSGADVNISGKTTTLKITANSGSDFDGLNLVTETCTAKATTGSDISVTVNKQLDATSGSGGDIHYRGNPEVRSNKSLGGGVRKVSK